MILLCLQGSYCQCHYCKCEKGHIHCKGHGHGGGYGKLELIIIMGVDWRLVRYTK